MKTIEKVERVVIKYVAEDGTEFEDKFECESYEKYCQCDLVDLLKPYMVFNNEAEKSIRDMKTPISAYILCIKEMPGSLEKFLEKYMQVKNLQIVPIPRKIFSPTLYYYNDNGLYDGWFVGWERVGTEEQLTQKIKQTEYDLEQLKKLNKRA